MSSHPSTPGAGGDPSRAAATTGPGPVPAAQRQPREQATPCEPGAAAAPAVRYEERLTVSWWVWLIVAFVGGAGFVAVAPISTVVGLIVAAVLVVGIGLAVHLGAPRIVLTDEDLRVGRAHIEREYVGAAEALRGAEARAARGPGLDGRAFMNFRVSVPDLCRIQIVDPVDPT
ncbi:DUF3093 domain-containing protein, partial [Kocuria tytonicola]|uniref:DUF3093 domain-containing protein n=1 Tax=Kocuria tytonicola TaxID=2055946 RepID=UPI001F0C36B1